MALLAQDLREAVLQAAFEGKLTKYENGDCNVNEQFDNILLEKEKLILSGYLKKTKKPPEITENVFPTSFPNRWIACYIDDVAFVTKLAGFEYSKYIAGNITTKGIPLFKGKNVQNGNLVLEFESYIPEDVSESLIRSQIRKKCLLTPYVGTIGNIAIFDGNFKAHLGSNVGKIELFNNENIYILEEYLLYYLRSSIGYQELTKYKKATAQESISIEAIRNVILPLPPVEEQRRIVERVEELMSKIDEFEKIENKLETLKKSFPEDMKASLLQAAMQGKLTEQLDTDTSVEVGEEIPNEEIPFDIPETWKWTYLNNIATINGGFAFKSSKYSQNGARVIRISDFNEDGFNDSNIVRYDYTDDLEQYIIENKNILLCMTGGTVGKSLFVNSVPEKMLSNQRVATIKIDGALPEYVYKVILSPFIQQMIDDSKNSTNDNISMTLIKSFPIPVPPIEEQERIVNHFEKLMNNFN